MLSEMIQMSLKFWQTGILGVQNTDEGRGAERGSGGSGSALGNKVIFCQVPWMLYSKPVGLRSVLVHLCFVDK